MSETKPASKCEEYITSQIITYIGNKRSLLGFIGKAIEIVKGNLNKDKIDILDLFSGSGIVSRYLKQYANKLYANDLEGYAKVLNECYLSNPSEVDLIALREWHDILVERISNQPKDGFIAELYAPKDIMNIRHGERCFYTTRNAKFIDTARQHIENVPEELKKYFIAPLLTEASVKNNTSGVFKGFYKNSSTGLGQFGGNNEDALSRITRDIVLPFPIFSQFECQVETYQEDANKLVGKLGHVDLVYMDPPYNQHPYGSNYFMLNLINEYKRPEDVSRISGIPVDWNRSQYNKSYSAYESLQEVCSKVDAKYLLISFNSEGFISNEQMVTMLEEIGKVDTLETTYNTFRGSRNLRNRKIHVKEYLYLVEKGK